MLSSSATSLGRMAMATRRATVPAVGAVRNINIHEYQSMELMKSFDIGIPGGHVASTPEEAENIYLNILNKRELCFVIYKLLTDSNNVNVLFILCNVSLMIVDCFVVSLVL
jgi:hypothetical protein